MSLACQNVDRAESKRITASAIHRESVRKPPQFPYPGMPASGHGDSGKLQMPQRLQRSGEVYSHYILFYTYSAEQRSQYLLQFIRRQVLQMVLAQTLKLT